MAPMAPMAMAARPPPRNREAPAKKRVVKKRVVKKRVVKKRVVKKRVVKKRVVNKRVVVTHSVTWSRDGDQGAGERASGF